MMKIDYSMSERLEQKIIYTLLDQKIFIKDTKYENRRSVTASKRINCWTQSKDLDKEITAHDAAVMMALLKIARTKFGAPTEDTYVDAAAYMAIAGECKHEDKEWKKQNEDAFI